MPIKPQLELPCLLAKPWCKISKYMPFFRHHLDLYLGNLGQNMRCASQELPRWFLEHFGQFRCVTLRIWPRSHAKIFRYASLELPGWFFVEFWPILVHDLEILSQGHTQPNWNMHQDDFWSTLGTFGAWPWEYRPRSHAKNCTSGASMIFRAFWPIACPWESRSRSHAEKLIYASQEFLGWFSMHFDQL